MSARPVHRVSSVRLLFVVVALAVALPGAVVAARLEAVNSSATSSQANDIDLYIVVQSAPPVALYQGGIAGLVATNPEARGEVKLDPDSAASRARTGGTVSFDNVGLFGP